MAGCTGETTEVAESADAVRCDLSVPPASAGGLGVNPVTAEQALFAATLGGARALGLENQIGALGEGMQADITVVSLNGAHQQPVGDPAAALVFTSSGRDVVLTMVAGKEIYRDGMVRSIDEHSFQLLLTRAKAKLDSAAEG